MISFLIGLGFFSFLYSSSISLFYSNFVSFLSSSVVHKYVYSLAFLNRRNLGIHFLLTIRSKRLSPSEEVNQRARQNRHRMHDPYEVEKGIFGVRSVV